HGAGAGDDANLNLPLALGSGDEIFLAAINDGLARIQSHDPSALLLSLGFDAFVDDPLSGLKVSTDGFCAAGAAIGGVDTPTVLIQEGGYQCDALGRNLTAFLEGFGRD
ncbi:MAG: histone deacetylase family protein, partial [Alphaproteobacteria bacterium]